MSTLASIARKAGRSNSRSGSTWPGLVFERKNLVGGDDAAAAVGAATGAGACAGAGADGFDANGFDAEESAAIAAAGNACSRAITWVAGLTS